MNKAYISDDGLWLVTVTGGPEGAVTFGPFNKPKALSFQSTFVGPDLRAVAWAAQAPDLRIVRRP